MPRFLTGIVVRILESRDGLVRSVVEVAGRERAATAFTSMTGTIAEGDRVVLNTTAVDLGLGTGGEDFVLWNLERSEAGSASGGHILKVRYTPWQVDVMAVEAPESPHHRALADQESLEGMPVVACSLHSQVPAAAAVCKSKDPSLRVCYLMTDGASLPMSHSNLVVLMRQRGVLDATITCGQAFGGDLEAVNVFSGLAAARVVTGADVAIVSPGPGVVGTGTTLGHTGMEQGQVLSAAGALGGRPVAALRVSFADPRDRHRVVSHHSIAALRLAALARSVVAVPELQRGKTEEILARLEESGLGQLHEVRVVDAGAVEALQHFDLAPTTMGRTLHEDVEFFEAAGAGGAVAGEEVRASGH